MFRQYEGTKTAQSSEEKNFAYKKIIYMRNKEILSESE